MRIAEDVTSSRRLLLLLLFPAVAMCAAAAPAAAITARATDGGRECCAVYCNAIFSCAHAPSAPRVVWRAEIALCRAASIPPSTVTQGFPLTDAL